jgi:uncharacterized protein with von Willebrand factor type A (vWA) domain
LPNSAFATAYATATFAATFDRALATYGVDAGTRRTLAFADTLERTRPDRPEALYWSARISMLPSIDDLDAFHAAFVDTVETLVDPDLLRKLVESVPSARAERPPERRRKTPPPPDDVEADERDKREAVLFLAMASDEERFATRDFAEMDDAERARSLRALARTRVAIDLRRSRRRRAAARGDRLDLRATMRAAARTAGELVRRRNSARRETPRPLVFLCDVSGSMAPYARALLQYARVVSLGRRKVRAFAFATRLTELTSIARRTNESLAMSAFGDALVDYGGGTRIGAALRTFNERYGRRGAARGGTVVILSDGWERDDPDGVAREMLNLRRLCRRIVWVNPQKKHPAFEPLARGMAAALPFVDALVTGHNLRSLDAIADAIEGTLRT